METRQLAEELLLLEQQLQRQPGPTPDPQIAARMERLRQQLLERLRPCPAGDRRQHPRIPARLEAHFRLPEGNLSCKAAEFSLGGLSLRGHLWIHEEQQLTLENLRCGARDFPLQVQAKVSWLDGGQQGPLAGVEFIGPGKAARRQLQRVMDHLFWDLVRRLVSDG